MYLSIKYIVSNKAIIMDDNIQNKRRLFIFCPSKDCVCISIRFYNHSVWMNKKTSMCQKMSALFNTLICKFYRTASASSLTLKINHLWTFRKSSVCFFFFYTGYNYTYLLRLSNSLRDNSRSMCYRQVEGFIRKLKNKLKVFLSLPMFLTRDYILSWMILNLEPPDLVSCQNSFFPPQRSEFFKIQYILRPR